MVTSAGSGVRNLVHLFQLLMTQFPSGLRTEYQQRRNFFVDCLAEEFHLHAVSATAGVWEGCVVYQASSKVKKSTSITDKYSARDRTMFSFVPPTAGMFVWVGRRSKCLLVRGVHSKLISAETSSRPTSLIRPRR
jgi:hypothetical protein